MFADYVKMGAKIALIAVITAAILVLFNVVQIPNLDFTFFGQLMGKGLAIVYHWVPGSNVILPIAFAMFGLYLAILGFELGAIAWRWIFKVNE